jgi:hypothetical protein
VGSAHERGGSARPAGIPPIAVRFGSYLGPGAVRAGRTEDSWGCYSLTPASAEIRKDASDEREAIVIECSLVRCCVSGLATTPRMRTPVAGFCRLVEPSPCTFRLLTPLPRLRFREPACHLWAPPSQLQAARSATAPRPGFQVQAPGGPSAEAPGAPGFRRARASVLPRDLEPPCPPPGLGGRGRKAQGA